MTRIETALARMEHEFQGRNHLHLRYCKDPESVRHRRVSGYAATPTGKALAALIEAAEAAVGAYGSDGEWDAMAVLAVARTAFRAATEPLSAGGER